MSTRMKGLLWMVVGTPVAGLLGALAPGVGILMALGAFGHGLLLFVRGEPKNPKYIKFMDNNSMTYRIPNPNYVPPDH